MKGIDTMVHILAKSGDSATLDQSYMVVDRGTSFRVADKNYIHEIIIK